MEKYLSGEFLYGDDFTIEDIQGWYNDEKEAYANLVEVYYSKYEYSHYALNFYHGFKFLPSNKEFKKVLGFGSAYGEEFSPIIDRIREIIVLEPSEFFKSKDINGLSVKYMKPNISGELSFKDDTFDLTTCFGVLHHIPNVSFVLQEIYRCLKPNGIVLIREPICSMGDWRKKRKGLTKRERGIPRLLFRKILLNTNFKIKQERYCIFAPLHKIGRFLKVKPWNSNYMVKADYFISRIFRFNYHYHPKNFIHKFTPTSVFYVLVK